MLRFPVSESGYFTGRLAIVLMMQLLYATALLSTPSGDAGDPEPSEGASTFTFSSDPGKVILVYSFYGVDTGTESTFTVFGDGRVDYQEAFVGSPSTPVKLLRRDDFYLVYSELDSLLRLAIDHGLMEASAESVQKKLGRSPEVFDCGHSALEIYLTSYQSAGKQNGNLQNKIVLHCPAFLSRFHDVDEYHGFRLLGEYLRNAHRDSVKEQQIEP